MKTVELSLVPLAIMQTLLLGVVKHDIHSAQVVTGLHTRNAIIAIALYIV